MTTLEPTGPQRTILVVDDEEDVGHAVQEFLRDHVDNVQVLMASSGAQGLGILRRQKVDLIVTDYNMPGMDGLQFLAAAKKVAPGIRHILVTAFLTAALSHGGEGIQGELVLQKPFVPGGLLRDVNDALSRSSS